MAERLRFTWSTSRSKRENRLQAVRAHVTNNATGQRRPRHHENMGSSITSALYQKLSHYTSRLLGALLPYRKRGFRMTERTKVPANKQFSFCCDNVVIGYVRVLP